MNTDDAVTAYVARSPQDHQELLRRLRTMIRERLPALTETLASRMPVYVHGSTWKAGFASRKKGVMFYAMDEALLDRFAAELGPLRTGKSCVELKVGAQRSLIDVLGLVDRILAAIAAGLGPAAGPAPRG